MDHDLMYIKKMSPRRAAWKGFWRQLSSDLDRVISGAGFWMAALAITMAIIAAGGKELFPKAEEIAAGLAPGYHRTLFQKGLRGEGMIFLLPLVRLQVCRLLLVP